MVTKKGALGGAVAIGIAALICIGIVVAVINHRSSQRMYRSMRFTQALSMRSKIVFDHVKNLMDDSMWLGTQWGVWNHTTNNTLWEEGHVPPWPDDRAKIEENIENKTYTYLRMLNTTHNGFSRYMAPADVNLTVGDSEIEMNSSAHLSVRHFSFPAKIEDNVRFERSYDIPYGALYKNGTFILEVAGNCTPASKRCSIVECGSCVGPDEWNSSCESKYEETIRKIVSSISRTFPGVSSNFEVGARLNELEYSITSLDCNPYTGGSAICQDMDNLGIEGAPCHQYCKDNGMVYKEHKCRGSDPSQPPGSGEYDNVVMGNVLCGSGKLYWCKCRGGGYEEREGVMAGEWATLQMRIWDENTTILTDEGYQYMQLNRTFNVSIQPPEKCDMVVLDVNEPKNITYTGKIYVNGSTSERANVTYMFDNGGKNTACNNCTSFSNSTTGLSSGKHNVTVVATDADDPLDNMTVRRDFRVADERIKLTINNPSDGEIFHTDVGDNEYELTLSGSTNKEAKIKYKFNSKTSEWYDGGSPCTSFDQAKDLSVGNYTVSVLAINKNDNTDRDAAAVEFRIKPGLNLTVNHPKENKAYAGKAKLNFTTNIESNMEYEFDDSGTVYDACDKCKKFAKEVSLPDGKHKITVTAEDWEDGSESVTVSRNFIVGVPPETPEKPIWTDVSCETGETGVPCEFKTNTTDPDGDMVYYMFDWDDGTAREWIGPHPSGSEAVASHTWSDDGFYNITVKAKDENDMESGWSEERLFLVEEGQEPSPSKTTLSGPGGGKVGEEYSFEAGVANPKDNRYKYSFIWGDGDGGGWYPANVWAGTSYTKSHTWSSLGTYTVKAKAKNSTGHILPESDAIVFEAVEIGPNDIYMPEGWNTIGWWNDTTTAAEISQMIDCTLLVTYWDAEQRTYRSYLPGHSPPPGFTIEKGMGLFVYTDCHTKATMGASSTTPIDMDLPKGWNLIGWYRDQPTDASSLAQSIEHCSLVTYWDAEQRTYRSYLPGHSPPPGFTIEKGMAIYVYVEEDSHWDGDAQ